MFHKLPIRQWISRGLAACISRFGAKKVGTKKVVLGHKPRTAAQIIGNVYRNFARRKSFWAANRKSAFNQLAFNRGPNHRECISKFGLKKVILGHKSRTAAQIIGRVHPNLGRHSDYVGGLSMCTTTQLYHTKAQVQCRNFTRNKVLYCP